MGRCPRAGWLGDTAAVGGSVGRMKYDEQPHLVSELTYMSWWRTSLATLAVALGIGTVLPDLVTTGSAWPYLVVGIVWALLSVAMAAYGAVRQRALHASRRTNGDVPPHPLVVNIFAATGVILVATSAALVLFRP